MSVNVTGNQGAMIYLAESLAGLKNEAARTNELLRELIEVARGASAGRDQDDEGGGEDEIAGLRSLLTPIPNAATK